MDSTLNVKDVYDTSVIAVSKENETSKVNESEVKDTSKVESTSNVKEVYYTSVIVVSSDEYVSQCTSREKRAIR